MPLLDHMESHIWDGSEASGDLWNGRWPSDLLSSLLSDSATLCIAHKSITKTLKWLQTLTDLLQTGQRAQFAARRTELLALDAKQRHETVLALRKRRSTSRSQTLFAAWKIPYTAPRPRRRSETALVSFPLPIRSLSLSLDRAHDKWVQYAKARSTLPERPPTHPPRLHRRIAKTSKREDRRTRQLKLRTLRTILLLCR